MKALTKRHFVLIGIAVLMAFVIFNPITMLICTMAWHMRVGKIYMDSLTPNEIQNWIARSKVILADYPNIRSDYYRSLGTPTPADSKDEYLVSAYGQFKSGRQLPSDLKKLGIGAIDMSANAVSYKWCGGMDHTELIIEKLEDGNFKCTARYNDENQRVIWP